MQLVSPSVITQSVDVGYVTAKPIGIPVGVRNTRLDGSKEFSKRRPLSRVIADALPYQLSKIVELVFRRDRRKKTAHRLLESAFMKLIERTLIVSQGSISLVDHAHHGGPQ